jgi:hypothetical protein
VQKLGLDLTVLALAASVSECTSVLPSSHATSSFSFANGSVSRNVCIGVFP